MAATAGAVVSWRIRLRDVVDLPAGGFGVTVSRQALSAREDATARGSRWLKAGRPVGTGRPGGASGSRCRRRTPCCWRAAGVGPRQAVPEWQTGAERHGVDREGGTRRSAGARRGRGRSARLRSRPSPCRPRLERRQIVLDRAARESRVAPADARQSVREDHLGQGVHYDRHRVVGARPRASHVLVGAAAEHDQADLAEKLGRRIVAARVLPGSSARAPGTGRGRRRDARRSRPATRIMGTAGLCASDRGSRRSERHRALRWGT